eukprot:COSAG05_NODE_45_length_25418_cov_92.923299_11_plen_347_part_00
MYCDAKASAVAALGSQAGSVVAAVSFSLTTAPTQLYDFRTPAGCQNWWRRFSCIFSVADANDLPASMRYFAAFSMLKTLSPNLNHLLGKTQWCAKLTVTHAFPPSAEAGLRGGRMMLKLTAKDDSGGRANLLLYDEWAIQGAPIQHGHTLIVSGARLVAHSSDPASLHPSHIAYDLEFHAQRTPEGRVVVIFPAEARSSTSSMVLTRSTFERPDLWPAEGQRTIANLTPPAPPPAADTANTAPTAAARTGADGGVNQSGRVGATGDGGGGGCSSRQPPSKRQRRAADSNSGGGRQYVYTEIGSLPTHSKHNFYGVIRDFRPPRPTRGQDLVMSMTLIDPSSYDETR